MPEVMNSTHEAQTINHLVACSSRCKVSDMVDDIMPLPVVDRQRVRDAGQKRMLIIESLTTFLLEHDAICQCVLGPEAWDILTVQERDPSHKEE